MHHLLRGRVAITAVLGLLLSGLSVALVQGAPSPTCESIVHEFYDYGCIDTEGTASCASSACVAYSVEGDATCGGTTCVAVGTQGSAECHATDACAAITLDEPASCNNAAYCAPTSVSGDASCETPSAICAATGGTGTPRCRVATTCVVTGVATTAACQESPTCAVASVQGDAQCGIHNDHWSYYYEEDVKQCVATAVDGDASCTRVETCVIVAGTGDATCGLDAYYEQPGPVACSATSALGDARCEDVGEDNSCVVVAGAGNAECREAICVAVSAMGDASATCLLAGEEGACALEPAVAPMGTPPTLVGVVATPGVGEVHVSWDVPETRDRHRVAAVHVERSLGGGPWTAIARVSVVEETRVDTAHLDKNVPAHTSARYRVRAENLGGALGAYSAVVESRWRPSWLPPPELDVDATGPGPFVGQAIVVWRAPPGAAGSVVRYDIYRSGGSEENVDPVYATISDAAGHAVGPGTEPRHRVASVSAAGDIRYQWIDETPRLPRDHYYVVAVDANGGFSAYSLEDSAIWTPPTFGTVPLIDVDEYGAPRGHVDVCGGPVDAVVRTVDDPRGCHVHLNIQTYADVSSGETGVHSNPYVDIYAEPGHAYTSMRTSNLGEIVLLGSANDCPTFGYEVGVTPFQSIRACN